jgi:hypothetical protein
VYQWESRWLRITGATEGHPPPPPPYFWGQSLHNYGFSGGPPAV